MKTTGALGIGAAVLLVGGALAAGSPVALAQGAASEPGTTVTPIEIELGGGRGSTACWPENVVLQVDGTWALHIRNLSQNQHRFEAPGLFASAEIRHVEKSGALITENLASFSIPGGDTVVVIFRPRESGTYRYMCTAPGPGEEVTFGEIRVLP